MYEIEKTVPLPSPWRNKDNNKYPFLQMEVGDSFYVPLPDGTPIKALWARVSCSAYNFSRKSTDGVKFSFRRDKGGIRCFRVS